ncbi:MAG: DUF222 domain-containing protein, partial [Solirubrobacterales bacterium]
ETARRLACDASLVAMVESTDGQPLSVGRKTRTISPSLRRALRARDGGCRFPGCTHHRSPEGHHIRHWADGGETSLENTVHLCRRHHRLLHEGRYTVERKPGDQAADEFLFRRPNGTPISASPPAVETDAGALAARNRDLGVEISPNTPVARSHGDRFDLDLTIMGIVARITRGP